MFQIRNNNIYLTRGDKATITLSIEDYTFKNGDLIQFKIYNKKQLNKEPILKKEITVTEEKEEIDISLTSKETKIGNIMNIPTEYWYEIELNNENTVIGYDNNGPKLFVLYPEGEDIDG